MTTPHWHKEIEILFIKEGKVNMAVNDKPMQLEKDDILIINSGDIHYILPSPGSERLVYQFDLSLFNELILLNEESQSLSSLFGSVKKYSKEWEDKTKENIGKLLMELYEEWNKKEEAYAYAVKSKLYNIIVLLYREVPKEKSESNLNHNVNSKEILEKLDYIFRYVEKNYKYPIKLNEIANEVGFSVYYFTKFFKKNTGKTFINFLNEYRIEKAKWILLNNDITISELVEEVGFGSVKTFYKVFKQKMNIAPIEFKNKYVNL